MVQRAWPLLAGAMVWLAIVAVCALIARESWPEYLAAEPDRNFDLTMRIGRLLTGAVASVVAGALVARLAGPDRKAVPIAAWLLFLISTIDHIRPEVWNAYPVWYHLVFLGYLVPLTLLGGRLVQPGATINTPT